MAPLRGLSNHGARITLEGLVKNEGPELAEKVQDLC